MTRKELIEQGFKSYYIRYTKGYVSRKANTDLLPAKWSERKKMWYVNMPCWESSRYCYREYFTINN